MQNDTSAAGNRLSRLRGVSARGWQAAMSSVRLRQFAFSLGPTSAGLGIQFVTFAITAKGLGVAGFGTYSAILGVCAISVEAIGLGGADLLVRATARDRGRFSRYFGNMLVLIGLTTVPVIAFSDYLVKDQLGIGLDGWHLLMALCGETMVARISTSIELTMVAHREVFRASLIRFATPSVRLAAAILYFSIMGRHALPGWIEIVLVQSLLMSAMALAVAMVLYGWPKPTLLTGEIGGGAAFAVNQFSRATQSNLDRVILARFASAEALGLYSAGARLLQIGLFPIQVMTRILYPEFFAQGAKGIAASRRFAVSNVPAMLAVGMLAGGAVALAGSFAPFVLGKDFAGSRTTALLLSFSLPLIAMQYLAADALTGAGFQRLRATIYGMTAVLFGLILVLGARIGHSTGVIVAYLVGHTILMITLWAATVVVE